MDVIRSIVQTVFRELPLGRVASWEDMCVHMMELIALCGDGNHLEIGVLHGGTAIMAALVKESLHHTGVVYAIDPLDGRDETSATDVSLEVLRTNLKYFNVANRVLIVRESSHPWPPELESETFITAYIDGDHNGPAPLYDWENVSPRILPNGMVWFDDCNSRCPGVQKACEMARNTPGWQFVELFSKHSFVLRKGGVLDE